MSSGGTFQTEIGLDHSLGTSRRAKRPQRLEDVEFAFDVAGPSPMPVVNVDDVLDTVLKDTAFPSQESHLVCDALFRSKSCRDIIQDTFWWARDALLLDEEDRSQEVQKQLRQIDALKEKASSELNAEQLQKLSREPDLRKQEAELKAALA